MDVCSYHKRAMKILGDGFSVFVLAVLFGGIGMLSGCTRFDLLNATVPACGFKLVAGISYGDLPRQKLDVYEPTHPNGSGDVVIFFYGGDWQTGSRKDYGFVGQALASRGFIAVLPDYRLYPEVMFPAFVEDGAKSVRWVRDHAGKYGGKPERIFLMGHSAGAHIAALLTLDGSYLKAVGLDREAIVATAGLSGPYDFVPPPGDEGVFGLEPNEKPGAAAQPISFVDGREPPMLLVHGLDDRTVDPGNAQRLADRIRQAGGSVKYIAYPGKGHATVVLSLAWPFRWLAPTLADVTEFFRGFDR
jgi:acetyl esterase/lipase